MDDTAHKIRINITVPIDLMQELEKIKEEKGYPFRNELIVDILSDYCFGDENLKSHISTLERECSRLHEDNLLLSYMITSVFALLSVPLPASPEMHQRIANDISKIVTSDKKISTYKFTKLGRDLAAETITANTNTKATDMYLDKQSEQTANNNQSQTTRTFSSPKEVARYLRDKALRGLPMTDDEKDRYEFIREYRTDLLEED